MKARYIDSMGNDISRSTYESLLAQNILEFPQYWKDVFDKLNAKIFEVIKYNIDEKKNIHFRNELMYRIDCISDFHPEFSYSTLMNELNGHAEYKTAYQNQVLFDFYKPFFETLIQHAYIPPNYLSGFEGASFAYRMRDEMKVTRPEHLFSDTGRGRVLLDNLFTTKNAGLLSEVATPKKLKSKFNGNVYSAKNLYRRDPLSPTIKLMEKHSLPFASGPSGTLGYLLLGVNALMKDELTQDAYRKLYMAIIASMVYQGHHSFADVGIVMDAIQEKEASAFKVDPSLSCKAYYDQFLTEEFRLSKEYHQFYTQYHPNKYSAMTWELLRDFLTEYNTNCKSFPEREYILELQTFSFENTTKHDELEPCDFEKFHGLVKKIKTEFTALETDEKKVDLIINQGCGSVLKKLFQKITDSGILLSPPETSMTWLQINELLKSIKKSLSKTSPSKDILNLLQHCEENLEKKSELTVRKYAQLLFLLKKSIDHCVKENRFGRKVILGKLQRKIAFEYRKLKDEIARDQKEHPRLGRCVIM